jgi:hypothetical protein
MIGTYMNRGRENVRLGDVEVRGLRNRKEENVDIWRFC